MKRLDITKIEVRILGMKTHRDFATVPISDVYNIKYLITIHREDGGISEYAGQTNDNIDIIIPKEMLTGDL